jgi:predicted metal-dependent hydrolase
MRRELRDHLGELLAGAMVDPARVPPVHWLHSYCHVVAVRGETLAPFHELLRRCIETADAFPLDPVGAAGSALVALDVLELRRAGEAVQGNRIPLALAHDGWDLVILEEHRDDLGEATLKARAFWDALRRVYERAAGPTQDLEEVLARAATLFNVGLYFEFHEILEGYWMGHAKGPMREFLQGLIQIAIGFYQIGRRNPVGALAQFQKGLEKAEGLGDRYLGLELRDFLDAVRTCRDTVAALGQPRIADFDPALVPQLRPLRAGKPS